MNISINKILLYYKNNSKDDGNIYKTHFSEIKNNIKAREFNKGIDLVIILFYKKDYTFIKAKTTNNL